MNVREYDIDDLKEGMSAHYTTCIDADAVAQYARLCGDKSPLHVDEAFGRRSTFECNLVHGMLIASHFSTVVGVLLPGKNALLASMHTDFIAPVPVGAEVTISGSVTSVNHAQRIITLRLLAFVDGEVCSSAEATVLVMEPHSGQTNGEER